MKTLFIFMILLISLFAFADTHSEDCEPILLKRIVIPSSIPRIPISKVAKNVYSFFEGENSFSPQKEVMVITYKGNDHLLAINAKAAYSMGIEEFLHTHLKLEDSSESLFWLSNVIEKFDNYTSPDLQISGLAELWHDSTKIGNMGRFFLAQFFDESLKVEPSDRTKIYLGPEKENRVLLISLVPPRSFDNSFKFPPSPKPAKSTVPAIELPPHLQTQTDHVLPRLTPFNTTKIWDFGGPSGKLRIPKSFLELMPEKGMQKYLNTALEVLLAQNSQTLMKDFASMAKRQFYVSVSQRATPYNRFREEVSFLATAQNNYIQGMPDLASPMPSNTFVFYKDELERIFLVSFSETDK